MLFIIDELPNFMLRNTSQYFNHIADKSDEHIQLICLKRSFKLGNHFTFVDVKKYVNVNNTIKIVTFSPSN